MTQPKEFWNELITRASWEKLHELTKEIDFILIGGWAAYLWTKAHKSKDIDIIVDYETLAKLRKKYTVEKNDSLKKYEIKLDQFDIDIYIPYYSVLELPVEILHKYTAKIENITVISPEILVILKQGAERVRRASVKGKKDAIDILMILYYAPFNAATYYTLLKEHKKENFLNELITTINTFDRKDLAYLGLNEKTFADWKKQFIAALKKK